MEDARKHFRTADHMAYVTFTLLKENRLMIKIMSELAESVRSLIKAFLYYEYSFKRVVLYKDPQRNLKNFVDKIAKRYIESQNVLNLVKILEIAKKHREAPVEFVKKDTFVMLLGDRYETLTMDGVKEHLACVRKSLKSFPENI